MRRRLYAILAVAALATATPGSAEEIKTLDGDKNKKIEVKAEAPLQQHDTDAVVRGFGLLGSGPDLYKCAPENCLRLDFKFSPTQNLAGDLVLTTSWVNEYSDMDLYFFDKDGKEIDHCGGATGTGEFLVIPQDKLVKGAKYTVISNYYRSGGEEVTLAAEFPATHEATYPDTLDDIQTVSCTE